MPEETAQPADDAWEDWFVDEDGLVEIAEIDVDQREDAASEPADGPNDGTPPRPVDQRDAVRTPDHAAGRAVRACGPRLLVAAAELDACAPCASTGNSRERASVARYPLRTHCCSISHPPPRVTHTPMNCAIGGLVNPISLSVIAATVFVPTFALAQPNPTFKYANDEERAALEKTDEVKWEAAAQAGLIMTTGNSRVTTFATGLTASRKEKQNKLSIEGAVSYARSSIFLGNDADGSGMLSEDEIDRPSTTTARSWNLKGRYDRFLTEKNALFVAAGVGGDRPAGKELVGNGQLGYSRQLYSSGPHTFMGEAGYDFTYEDLVAASDGVAIHSVRGFAGYKGTLSDDTALEGSIEGLFNLNELTVPNGGDNQVDRFGDNRVNSKISLTTKLSTKLSFRFSFEAKFDSAPAPRPALAIPFEAGFVPLADELDTKTEATLIVSLL